MHIEFTTTDEASAFKRIQKVYPDRDVTAEDAEPLLKLVRDGIIRVGDPLMYGSQIPVTAGPNFAEVDEADIHTAHRQFLSNIGVEA